MDEFIARQNIERYRRMLAEEMDANRRDSIRRLLEEEEAKLGRILAGMPGGLPQDTRIP